MACRSSVVIDLLETLLHLEIILTKSESELASISTFV
jgi:hypothetical protein